MNMSDNDNLHWKVCFEEGHPSKTLQVLILLVDKRNKLRYDQGLLQQTNPCETVKEIIY